MLTCPSCRELNLANARYCSSCGSALVAEAEDTTGTLRIVDDDTLPTGTDAQAEQERYRECGYLMIQTGAEAGSWFRLDRPLTTIGRHPDSDVLLNDVTVSRRHAEIRFSDGEYFIRDVGSLNGTYLSRDRVEEERLCPGDEIQIGKFRFLFLRQAQDR